LRVKLLDSKGGFLALRGMLAIVGFARTILILRLLATEEYAVLGVAESLRVVVTALVGLGLSEAVAREGGSERDPAALGRIAATGLAASAVLALLGLLVMLGFAAFIAMARPGGQLALAVLVAAPMVAAERIWGVLLATEQARHAFRGYALAIFWHGVGVAVLTVLLTALWGVNGYFAGQACVTALGAILLARASRKRLQLPTLSELRTSARATLQRLTRVAWFAFVAKSSQIAWRRLPLLASATVLPPATIGLAAATLDLTSKLHLAYEALLPMVMPRLARAHRDNPGSFAPRARAELRYAAAVNVSLVAAALLGWWLLGEIVVGAERFADMRTMLVAAVAMESVLLVANTIVMCVLLPTGQVAGLSVLSLLLRLLAVPCVFLALAVGVPPQYAIFAAMGVSGVMVMVVYLRAAARALAGVT
jgi:O-antigen/teichoic acid export membrane protein